MNLDYDPIRRKYTMGGQVTTWAAAISVLRADGLTEREARHILHAHKLAATIEHRLPPRRPDMVGGKEAVRIVVAIMMNGLDRARNLPKAERWIRENLRPAKKPGRSAYSLKHECDHDYQEIGDACYLRESDFIDCLRRCGIAVSADGYVYAKEVRP